MHDEKAVAEWMDQVKALATALPETSAHKGGSGYKFQVRKKTFAYFLVDHHADDRVGLWFKGAPGVQQELIESEGDRFYVPPYVGPAGWVGLDFEAAPVDFGEIEQMLVDSYCLVAPKTLAAKVR